MSNKHPSTTFESKFWNWYFITPLYLYTRLISYLFLTSFFLWKYFLNILKPVLQERYSGQGYCVTWQLLTSICVTLTFHITCSNAEMCFRKWKIIHWFQNLNFPFPLLRLLIKTLGIIYTHFCVLQYIFHVLQ